MYTVHWVASSFLRIITPFFVFSRNHTPQSLDDTRTNTYVYDMSHITFGCVLWHVWMNESCDTYIGTKTAVHYHIWYYMTRSFIYVTWLIHMCDMTHPYVWYDSSICVIWLIHMCDMTHPYVWYDSSICVTAPQRCNHSTTIIIIQCMHLWLYTLIYTTHTYCCIQAPQGPCNIHDGSVTTITSQRLDDAISLQYSLSYTRIYLWLYTRICTTHTYFDIQALKRPCITCTA